MSGRRVGLCACGCERSGPLHGRGLVEVCYRRRQRDRTLGDFPTARESAREGYVRTGLCACCGVTGEIEGRGLIKACYRRHWEAGTLAGFPTRSDLAGGAALAPVPQAAAPAYRGRPGRPAAPRAYVAELLRLGHAVPEVERASGWPAGAIRRLVAATPGWLLDACGRIAIFNPPKSL